MSRSTGRPRTRRSIREIHQDWLGLVDTEGPFLALPVLTDVWSDGVPRWESGDSRHTTFVDAYRDWDHDPHDPHRRDAWVTTVLTDLAGWGDRLSIGGEFGRVASPDGSVKVSPWGALVVGDDPVALVTVLAQPDDYLAGADPHAAGTDGWSASAIDRMALLLRSTGVAIGIVTDGRWWSLVWAEENTTTGSGTVDAWTWREEPLLRDAFLALIRLQQLAGGEEAQRLPKLLERSVLAAEEITEALGTQVRQAVELLVQSFSESRLDSRQRALPDPLPERDHEVYEAAVTVMMRVVFLLFAEERGLLPDEELFRGSYGMAGVLDGLDERARNDGEENLDHTCAAWHRLLATSTALYGGASFEDVRMPAYGGSLFDPERFPWIRAENPSGGLRLRVSDRVMLHVLRAVQIAQVGGEARRITFRDVDVEQIGYIYEGLLGYTARTVLDSVVVGLEGKAGDEPEARLSDLEEFDRACGGDADKFAKKLRDHVAVDQPAAKPKTARQIAKAYTAEADEAEARRLLTPVCGGDAELADRLVRWYPMLRQDLRGLPLVIPEGGLVVAETPSRKNAGAHYTPRSLAEQVVLHALQPLVYQPGPLQTDDSTQWVPIKASEILALKVTDIACGSGAFLVAAARYLAGKLLEAWTRDGFATGWTTDELERRALREVIAHCIYGADINDMALEMCKLSLWLVSLDASKPFSFVDDKIFHGNSLLGVTSEQQLTALHIDPKRADDRIPLQHIDVHGALERARMIREQLASPVDEHDPQRSTNGKRRLLAQAREVTVQLRDIADGVIATGLIHGGKPGNALDDAYRVTLADALVAAYPRDGSEPDQTELERILADGLTPTVFTDYERWKPLHWAIEAPDVIIDHSGFDAVIGNPPFLGGQKLTGAYGTNIRDWFVNQIADGARGSADLIAYFFLRAMDLLAPDRGQLGLIATNTVAQGDTRQVGLQRMLESGLELTRCVQSACWPSTSANLQYASVWGSLNSVAAFPLVKRVADDVGVPRISSLLEAEGQVVGEPARLKENSKIAFQGSNLLGKGFLLESGYAQQLLDRSAHYADVVQPCLNGDDLNSRPDCSASRWVINFHDWSIGRSSAYDEVFRIVEELVRPEREKVTYSAGAVERWWQYEKIRPDLNRAIAKLRKVIVIALVSKTVMPALVANGQVFTHALAVFATDDLGDLAMLSSSLHQTWAIKYGSGMRNDPRYTPSDVFETFPRPVTTERMREAGTMLDRDRREIMLRRSIGLTDLYNLVNDPEVTRDKDVELIRSIHSEIDHAVLEAYGWDDVDLGHGFHTYRQMHRYTMSPTARVELMDRLLAENHRRAALEAEVSGRKGKTAPKRRVMQDEGLF